VLAIVAMLTLISRLFSVRWWFLAYGETVRSLPPFVNAPSLCSASSSAPPSHGSPRCG